MAEADASREPQPEGPSPKSPRLEAPETGGRDGQEASDSAPWVASRCHIDQLPPELLSRILSMLDQTSRSRCAQLSSRWQQLAMQPLLWRRIRISSRRRSVSSDLTRPLSSWLSGALLELDADFVAEDELGDLEPLLIGSPRLQFFSASVNRFYADELLLTLGRCWPSLLSLRLHFDQYISANGLALLIRLTHLDLSGGILDTDFHQLADLASRLTSLSLRCNLSNSDTEEFVSALPECCPSLSTLALNWIEEHELQLLLPRLPSLTDLTLSTKVTDSLAAVLANACGSRLRALELESCSELSADGLAALLDCCPRLQRLQLHSLQGLDGACYSRAVPRLPPDLEVLKLDGISWLGMEKAQLELPLPPSLRQLELCGSFSGESSDCVDRSWVLGLATGLAGCKVLTHLTLDACHDELLPALLAQLPRLRCLRLTDCRRLTRQAWASLRRFAASPPDLHELRADGCSEFSLTDEAIADLCASPVARGLRRLSLSSCERLTGAALSSIASGCPWLSSLILKGFQRCLSQDDLIEAGFEQRVDLSGSWQSER